LTFLSQKTIAFHFKNYFYSKMRSNFLGLFKTAFAVWGVFFFCSASQYNFWAFFLAFGVNWFLFLRSKKGLFLALIERFFLVFKSVYIFFFGSALLLPFKSDFWIFFLFGLVFLRGFWFSVFGAFSSFFFVFFCGVFCPLKNRLNTTNTGFCYFLLC